MNSVITGFISCPKTTMGVMTSANKLNITHSQLVNYCEKLVHDGMLIKQQDVFSPTDMAKAMNGDWDMTISNKKGRLVKELYDYEQKAKDIVVKIHDIVLQAGPIDIKSICNIINHDIHLVNYSISLLIQKKIVNAQMDDGVLWIKII